MKVLINDCFGGFGISTEGFEWLIKNKNWKVTEFKDRGYKDETAQIVLSNSGKIDMSPMGIEYYFTQSRSDNSLRTNADLIEMVETLGSEKASGRFSELKILEIPDNVDFTIEDYDGSEHIAEVHRTWR